MPDLPQHAYHSQLAPPVASRPADRYALGDSVAFRYDLTDVLSNKYGELPEEYRGCDILYSELPWRNGMDAFNERAGMSVTYADFMAAVSRVVLTTPDIPVILVTGRHALSRLPEPSQVLTTSLNADPAVALLYNTRTKPVNTATELITRIADRFDRVGDFCCGYGRTLRIFHRVGGTFVGSDYNASCIGYIADHAEGWGHVHPE